MDSCREARHGFSKFHPERVLQVLAENYPIGATLRTVFGPFELNIKLLPVMCEYRRDSDRLAERRVRLTLIVSLAAENKEKRECCVLLSSFSVVS